MKTQRLGSERLRQLAEDPIVCISEDARNACIELLRQRRLEQAVRALDHISHHDECNVIMGWGLDNPCDCPAAEVKASLKDLD